MKTIQSAFIYKVLSVIILSGFSFNFLASNPLKQQTYFEHLYEVNQQWEYHKEACLEGETSFHSDIDRIQLHLNLVIKELKNNVPVQFNQEQKNHRLNLLDKLQEYADNKVFPINKYHSKRTPYFVDDYGTNCAVGQIIWDSGNEDLVRRISAEHNYDYIKDIKTEGLIEWAEKYGFTIDELKWIQPGYSPGDNVQQVSNGTNGEIKVLKENLYHGGLLIAGEFTELDSLPCLNVGYLDLNNQLNCLGNGIEGKVNFIGSYGGDIYAFGELFNNNTTYPIAKFNENTWEFISIPDRVGAISTVAVSGTSNFKPFQVAIYHSSFEGQQEVWEMTKDQSWERIAKVNGTIYDIKPSSYGRVYAGHFDTVEGFNNSDTTVSTITVKNVAFKSNNSENWHGITEHVSDTVYSIFDLSGTLYFGGGNDPNSTSNNVVLSRYLNGVAQPVILSDYTTGNMSINSIEYSYILNEFILGGNFTLSPMVGVYGTNLARYSMIFNLIEGMAVLDGPVNTLQFYKNNLYLGGDFTLNVSLTPVNYLGVIDYSTSAIKSIETEELTIYPNPFSSVIHIDGLKENANYSLYSMSGKLIQSGAIENRRIDDLQALPKGAYILEVETKHGVFKKKVLK